MQVPQEENNKATIFYPNFCFREIYQTKRLCLASSQVLISHFTSRETRYEKLSNLQKVYFWTINLKTSCTLWLPGLSYLLHKLDREQGNTFGRILSPFSHYTAATHLPLTGFRTVPLKNELQFGRTRKPFEDGLKVISRSGTGDVAERTTSLLSKITGLT